MIAYFETSKGQVTGNLENNKFVPDPDGIKLLNQLYVMGLEYETDVYFLVENGWVFIPLDDSFYGNPEYKLVVFTE